REARGAARASAARIRDAGPLAQDHRARAARIRCRDKKKPAGAKRHPQGGRAYRGPLFPRVFSPEFTNRARRAVAKLNLLLLAVLVACALGLVTSQHRARKLFSELER